MLDTPVPRFILQPIVENSIYHGLEDDGEIVVSIRLESDELVIEVKDDGRGMSEEKIQRILHTSLVEEQKQGMGIGLNYVKRILEKTYGRAARIEMVSNEHSGTRVLIFIPKWRE